MCILNSRRCRYVALFVVCFDYKWFHTKPSTVEISLIISRPIVSEPVTGKFLIWTGMSRTDRTTIDGATSWFRSQVYFAVIKYARYPIKSSVLNYTHTYVSSSHIKINIRRWISNLTRHSLICVYARFVYMWCKFRNEWGVIEQYEEFAWFNSGLWWWWRTGIILNILLYQLDEFLWCNRTFRKPFCILVIQSGYEWVALNFILSLGILSLTL